MKNNKNIEKPLLGDDNEELRTVTLLKVCAIFALIGGVLALILQKPDYSAHAIICFVSSILLYAFSHIVNFLNKINENLEAIKNKTVPKEIDKETNNND